MPTISELRAKEHEKEHALKCIPVTDMMLRDWFAGQALTGLAASDAQANQLTAQLAYKFADDMMKERVK